MDPAASNTPQPVSFDTPPSTPSKKLLLIIVAAGVLVLLIALVVTSFLFGPHQKQNNQPTQTAQSVTPNVTSPTTSQEQAVFITPPPPTKPTVYPYQLTETFDSKTAPTQDMTHFSVQYPADWPPTITKFPAQKQAIFSIFPDTIDTTKGHYPRLDIAYFYSTDSGAMQQRADTVLQEATSVTEHTTFHGVPAIKIYGPLHLILANSTPPNLHRTLYKTFYIFEKDNWVYLVDYAYDGETPNPTYEKYMNDVLTTFKFVTP